MIRVTLFFILLTAYEAHGNRSGGNLRRSATNASNITTGTLGVGVLPSTGTWTTGVSITTTGTINATTLIGDGSQISGVTVTGASLPNFVRKTTTYTAQVRERIITDTSGGSIDITPPTTGVGAWFEVFAASGASTNAVRILTNGNPIDSATSIISIDEDRVTARFVYLDAVTGWAITSP